MSEKRKRFIFLLLYISYSSIYVLRLNLSVGGPEFLSQHIMSTAQLGLMGSAFSVVYALGRLFNGSLSDSMPPWTMLFTGLSLAGAFNLLIGFFPPYAGLFLLWTGNALAQSMLWSTVTRCVSGLYSRREAKRKMSFMISSSSMGTVAGIILNTFLISAFGLKWAFALPGTMTLILGFLCLSATKNLNLPQVEKKAHISFFTLLKDRRLLKMCVPALVHGVMKENVALWMTVYVVESYGVNLAKSAGYVLLIPLVGFLGRLLYPAAFRLCRENENIISLSGLGVCAACSLLLFGGGLGILGAVTALSGVYLAVSMVNTSLLSMFPLSFAKSGNVASVSGIMDFATYLGGGITGGIYGKLIGLWGYGPMFLSWAVLCIPAFIIILKQKKV